MTTAIKSYLDSLSAPQEQHLRLVLENGSLQAKQQDEISFQTGFWATIGFGDASFKKVFTYIRDHRAELKIDSKMWRALSKVVSTYNATHLFWKRIDYFSSSSLSSQLYDFDPLSDWERQRIEQLPLFPNFPPVTLTTPSKMAQFCRDLRHKWNLQEVWEESEVDELITYLDNFQNAIQSLGKNERFVDSLLQLLIALKLSLVANDTGLQKIKEIQTLTLRTWFHDELAKQEEVLERYKKASQPLFGTISPFLKHELERWQRRHDHGKLISFPKWYHCTPTAQNVLAIFHSEIAFKQIKGFAGAFVSTQPEMENYGRWCFALSDHIETTATKMDNGTTRLPRYSQFFGDVSFSKEKKEFSSFWSFRTIMGWLTTVFDAQIWFGFQRGIPITRVLKREHPLEYFRDTTLSYLVYDETKNVRNPILHHFPQSHTQKDLPQSITVLTATKGHSYGSFFQSFSSLEPGEKSPKLAQKGFDKRRVHVITRSQLEQVRELYRKAKQQFTLPSGWEGNLQSC